MAATVASATHYSEDAASPLTASLPASTASGDLLVFAIAQGDSVIANLTAPAGWTATSSANGGSVTGKLWTKVAGSEPSTYDFPYSSGADVAAVMVRVTGADTTPTLVQAVGTAGPNAGNMDSPTVTPTGSDDLLIVVMSAACGGTTLVETDPSSTTDLGQGQVAGGFQALATAYQQLASGSATGAKTWSSITPATKPGVSFSLAIKSAGAAPAAVTPQPIVGPGPAAIRASTW